MRIDSSLAAATVSVSAAAVIGALGFWRVRVKKSCKLEPTCRASWLRDHAAVRDGISTNPVRIVLVATGSVASVKVPELSIALGSAASEATGRRAEVVVVLTKSAEVMVDKVAPRYASKGIMEQWVKMQASHQIRVLRDQDEWDSYQEVSEDLVVHVELRKWADAVVVAPCSANTIAKIACGLCDNLATCLIRAWDFAKPIIVAPAMNTLMWDHPATRKHLETMTQWGIQFVDPMSKRLACGDVGKGALARVEDISVALRRSLDN